MFSNLSRVKQSYSVAFSDYVRECEEKGRKIIKMQSGDPDFPTHPNVINAAHEAMLNGETKYCDSRGAPILRDAVRVKLEKTNKICGLSNDNILITHGAVHAVGMAIRALVNPGDEAIILEPYWRAYEMNILLAGGMPVIHRMSRENNFQMVAEDVIAKITNRTKVIIINTPNNPSGVVYARNELRKLAEAAAEKSVYVISDEVYEAITFHSASHYSISSDPKVFDWVVSIFSFSKTYAMTGWRIGYLVGNSAVVNEILKLSQFSVTSLSPFSQRGAITALTDVDVSSYVEFMRRQYQKRREMIRRAVDGTFLESAVLSPQGTFYALIDISQWHTSSLSLAKEILDKTGVAFTPGIAFGDSMDGYLRMCFAAPEEYIGAAVSALQYLKEI